MPLQDVIRFSPVANTTFLTATTTSTAVALSPAPQALVPNNVRVVNTGTAIAYLTFGGAGITATSTTGIPIPINAPPEKFNVSGVTHVAHIAGVGSTTIAITPGQGS